MKQKKILIITHSADNECIKMVEDALEARNAEPYRLNTDTFPIETLFSLCDDTIGKK